MKWTQLNSVYFASDLFHALARSIRILCCIQILNLFKWNFVCSPPVVISWLNRWTKLGIIYLCGQSESICVFIPFNRLINETSVVAMRFFGKHFRKSIQNWCKRRIHFGLKPENGCDFYVSFSFIYTITSIHGNGFCLLIMLSFRYVVMGNRNSMATPLLVQC